MNEAGTIVLSVLSIIAILIWGLVILYIDQLGELLPERFVEQTSWEGYEEVIIGIIVAVLTIIVFIVACLILYILHLL